MKKIRVRVSAQTSKQDFTRILQEDNLQQICVNDTKNLYKKLVEIIVRLHFQQVIQKVYETCKNCESQAKIFREHVSKKLFYELYSAVHKTVSDIIKYTTLHSVYQTFGQKSFSVRQQNKLMNLTVSALLV